MILWCVMIFCITSSPAATSTSTSSVIRSEIQAKPATIHKIDFGVRKAAHVTLFGVLAVLLYTAIGERKVAAVTAWIGATLYGATDEIHQMFAPGRTPSVTDVGIDSAGALAALILFYLLRLIASRSGLLRRQGL
ncbi:VanZ family protein [Paenibacillus doosanensis]|nr:VanZ family protein [Paenibacillus konkukensis]MCS7463351.1 VanZ family protein [Paenibacillus doosanensis]